MKRLFILFVSVLVFSLGASAVEKKEPVKKYTQEEWDNQTKKWDKESWMADLKLEYPGEWLKGVVFLVVDKDPMESYKQELEKNKDFYIQRSSLKDAKDMDVQIAWNSIFRDYPASDVSFLENNPEKGSKHGYGSSSFKRTWLVTKAIGSNGKQVCWGLRLNVKKGKTIEVKLTDKNAVSGDKLIKIYDSIVK